MNYLKTWSKRLTLATLLTASTSCYKTTKIKVPVPVYVTDCIDEKPPAKPNVVFVQCGSAEACLDLENARKLLKYIHTVQNYMDDTYTACGKKEEPVKEETK